MTVTEQDYTKYLGYTRSLLFYNKEDADDIVHNVLLEALEKGYGERYIMFKLRMAVLDRYRTHEIQPSPPTTAIKPDVEKKIQLQEFLTALDKIRIYKRGRYARENKDVDIRATTKAHTIVRMSFEGYSMKEISKALDMDGNAVKMLKGQVMKRIKKQLEMV